MEQLSDHKERALALDTSRSFIVQAPAGSGKTSLLVQRYLKLLAQVEAPEEIIAITFTRKAAFEMRTRIMSALENAAHEFKPQSAYAATLQQLAQAALRQSDKEGWHIIANGSRLRIQTIDALCHYLVQRAPMLSKASLAPQIVQGQELESYYREAAKAMVAHCSASPYLAYLNALLLHLDNNWRLGENLCVTMLKSREQWLPHIVGLNNVAMLRQNMEQVLQSTRTETLEQTLHLFPQELVAELTQLLHFAKNNDAMPTTFLPQLKCSTPLYQQDVAVWQNIAQLLLTKEFAWRKKVTGNHGFPPQTLATTKTVKELFKTMKLRMENLLAELANQEELRSSLENLLLCPPPTYSDSQWHIIEALLELLPLMAAQLKVIFNSTGTCDYTELSMAAAQALGTNEMPSELALNLDYRFHHILVDEFQDTSVAQYRLLEKLTTAWQEGDGRTLFVVGDPMQSIYRFREAEVGIFLRTQQEGIGDIKLTPLTLTTNFRASANLVAWANNNFPKIFPPGADISLGAVPFTPATAVTHDSTAKVAVEIYKNGTATTTATRIVQLVHQIKQQEEQATIAILVKARSHLAKIIPAIKQAKLSYQAEELETLNKVVVVRDLYALTRALLDLTDRIAWLAILHAPWCGLSLGDLHQVAIGTAELIWDNICNYTKLNLSPDGATRVGKLKLALTPIIPKIRRVPWRELVEEAWLLLGGPATVAEEAELEFADTYLALLTTNFTVETLQKQLDTLYAPATPNTTLQIMTIHKAKGLEFDHVIIPGIERTTRAEEHKLMLWFERPGLHHASGLILAPIKPTGDKPDPVYRYLQTVEQKKSSYEEERLLYVALTRAKKSVTMVGQSSATDKDDVINNIQNNSLLGKLKPCFNNSWLLPSHVLTTPQALPQAPETLLRLSSGWESPLVTNSREAPHSPSWYLPDQEAATIGTVIHYCLKQLSREPTGGRWQLDSLAVWRPYWRKLLYQKGATAITAGVKLVEQAIKTTLSDPRGRWLLTNHKEAASELHLTTKVGTQLHHFIIDRTFIDENNIRWIIDYKTAQPTGYKNYADFYAAEQLKHEAQLQHYAQLMHTLDPTRTIKLGLYFPLFGGWCEY